VSGGHPRSAPSAFALSDERARRVERQRRPVGRKREASSSRHRLPRALSHSSRSSTVTGCFCWSSRAGTSVLLPETAPFRAKEKPRAASPSLVDDDPGVAYDEDLANRIRELIASEPDVSERTMFGGLVFLVGGRMSVAAGGQGSLGSGSFPRRQMCFSPSHTRNHSRWVDGKCRDGYASTRRASEPNASSKPGSVAPSRTHARFRRSDKTASRRIRCERE
jgi:hypothetical protein